MLHPKHYKSEESLGIREESYPEYSTLADYSTGYRIRANNLLDTNTDRSYTPAKNINVFFFSPSCRAFSLLTQNKIKYNSKHVPAQWADYLFEAPLNGHCLKESVSVLSREGGRRIA